MRGSRGETVRGSGGERMRGSVEGCKGKGSWKAMMLRNIIIKAVSVKQLQAVLTLCTSSCPRKRFCRRFFNTLFAPSLTLVFFSSKLIRFSLFG